MEQGGELAVVEAVAGAKVVFLGGFGEAVPGADNLAVVATKHAIADGFAKFQGNRAFVFDGQIGNTAPGIQYIRFGKGLGGADFQASAAIATLFFFRGGIGG